MSMPGIRRMSAANVTVPLAPRRITNGAPPWSRRILATAAQVSVTLLAAGSPAAAAADQAPRLGLTPVGREGAYFDLTLRPTESFQLQVEAANFGEEETVARTYAADVYSLVNGGFGAELFGDDVSGTTTWLSYPTAEFTLGPREATLVTFEVEVPAGTAAGQYVAALVIENVEPVRDPGLVALDQVNRNAIAVAIEVPGAREPALAIGGVAHKSVLGTSFLVFDVINPGNTHLRPAGAFRLLDAGGSPVSGGSLAMDIIYAGTRTQLEAALSDPLPRGDYCAELTLTDPETGATATIECTALTPASPPPEGPNSTTVGPGTLPGTDQDLVPARLGLVLVVGSGLVVAALLLAAWRRRRRGTSTSLPHRGWTP
jgi:hypothetical protein